MKQLTDEEIRYMKAMREHLHENPELSCREYKTAEYVEQKLAEWGIPSHRVDGTGVCGILTHVTDPVTAKTVAIRGDMDALPVQEESGVSFASKTPGVMHACGHDVHTASLLEAARRLAEDPSGLNGTVKFFFQHAEEHCVGAKAFVAAGEVEDVDRIIAIHMCPSLPVGQFSVRGGECSASTDKIVIRVKGRSSHGATPHLAVDAIYVASQIVVALQGIIARNLNPTETGVVSIGHFESGSGYNVLAGEAFLEGTTRAFNPEVRTMLNCRVREVAENVAAAYGAEAEFELFEYTDPLINDAEVASEVREVVTDLFGEQAAVSTYPKMMLGDDFAIYLTHAKGMYIWTGCSEGEETSYALHNCRFRASDKALVNAEMVIEGYVRKILG